METLPKVRPIDRQVLKDDGVPRNNDIPGSVQNLLPIGEFNPLEQKVMYLYSQGTENQTIGWILGLTPEQLNDYRDQISLKLAKDEKAALALSFSNLLNLMHPIQIDGRIIHLTPRGRDIFSLLAAGYTSPEIADRLNICRRTAENYRLTILEEFGARNKVEAVSVFVSAIPPEERGGYFPLIKKPTPPGPLSEREKEILSWQVKGKTSLETAELLSLSPKTVYQHWANIRTKLHTATSTSAATIALAAGLI